MSLQSIVDLNNNSVAHLAAGNANSAMKALTSAIVAMRETQESIEVDVAVELLTQGRKTPSVEISQLQDPIFYVYNKAPLLDTSDDIASANAVLLFNMALTLHRWGLECSQTDKLRKSFRLYGLAYQIAATLGASPSIISIACLNNQAAICYSMTEYDAARELLDSIPEAADVAMDSLEPLSLDAQEGLDEICLNVTIMPRPTAAASA